MSDIEGSTRLLRSLGEGYAGVLAEHYRLLREAFAAAGGTLVSTDGDAMFAAFPDAASAVRGVLDAQRALMQHAWPQDVEVRVRMGVHSGEGRLLGTTYVGLDVHRAARVAAAAHGGQVLLTDAARALAAGSLPASTLLRDLGEHRLKDLERAERLFQLVSPDLRSDFPPVRTLQARERKLPAQLTSFVGRERERSEVVDLLGLSRSVTLTGPGGTGKTRLSIEAAGAYVDVVGDSVYFVPLAPILDADLVIPTIAATLGVRETASRPIRDSVIEQLQERSTLLVLDNFEQLMAAAPSVADLLAAAAGLKTLITSREPLRIAGEQEFPVPPLDIPDTRVNGPLDGLLAVASVDLFVQRARSVRPGFELTAANAGAVAEICARLDGLPLAIELAAARSRLFEPPELLSRLDRRLTFLTGGPDVSDRQRTLRGAIDWSHELLDEFEQVLFRRMAVFAGGCTLEAVEAVCAREERDLDAVEGVSSLHDKSLLRRDDPASGVARVSMLETIRQYAIERLNASPDATDTRSRHAQFFLGLAEQASRHVRGPDGPEWLDRLMRELDNFRAAIRWTIASGDVEPGLRLAAALDPLWIFGNHLREGRRHLEELLAHPRATLRPDARAAALGAAARIAAWQGDYVASRPLARESLAIYREKGDLVGMARQLSSLGYAEILADAVGARRLFAESIAAYRNASEPPEMGESLIGMAMTEMQLGDVGEAIGHLDEAKLIFERAGDEPLALIAAGILGLCDRLTGDLTAARRRFVDVLIRSHQVGADVVTTLPIAGLADLALIEGDAERAAILDAAQARIAERLGGTPTIELAGIPGVADRARAALGDDGYRAAEAIGRAMPIDEVIRVALPADGDAVSPGDASP